MIDFAALTAPFPPDKVSWRIGHMTQDKSKAQALAYIDARDVYDRLDSVVGAEQWQCRYSHADKKTICEIGIKSGEEWIWKANGAGDSDIEAAKGALSDAVKRAAVVWGIGRYLYDVKSPWVAIEAKGRSYVIKDSERPKLLAALYDKSQENVERGNGRNGSTRPPPSNPVSPPTGADAEARLVRGINDRSTIVALNKFTGQSTFMEAFNSLDEGGRDRVQDAINARTSQLNNLGAG